MCNSYTLLDLLLSYIENLFLVNGEWEMEGDAWFIWAIDLLELVIVNSPNLEYLNLR